MVTKCRLSRSSPADRREHIIAVAIDVFAQEGLGASTMATIAERLGGSKATLYKYFPSKELLFEAVIKQRCEHTLASLRDLRDSGEQDLEALLSGFGEQFLRKIYEPSARDIHRLVQSEGVRFPGLAQTFFHAGPNAVLAELRAMLTRFVAQGSIVCADPELAAGQFCGMLRGDLHLRFAMGLEPAPDLAEVKRQARHAARIFVSGLKTPANETGV